MCILRFQNFKDNLVKINFLTRLKYSESFLTNKVRYVLQKNDIELKYKNILINKETEYFNK